jgi:alginate O-acetyltransferase complex protein AlgI
VLFNSYIFILCYLPLTLGVFFWLGTAGRLQGATAWLVLMSLAFYGWWNPVYLGLIVASMVFNYGVGVALGRRGRGSPAARRLLAFGVTADLALLGYYKYANFFVDNWNALGGTTLSLGETVLPLGISFFTFTQIAYLVDAYRGEAREYNPLHYALFVTYFPHLIAGPVLHHSEMMPQFGKPSIYRINIEHFTAGTVYFLMGLFKKVVIADGIAVFASPVFGAAASGEALSALDAWAGALAYTFQLYFDFSGYSDMAVGLAMMMGVRLPLNFNSPYKATNISDFWRRWHMTLSRFLRDYLYIALGGNRRGPARRYVNLFLTMLLGGLWHGAGWTFVIWGALHGLYLIVNHGWHTVTQRRDVGGPLGRFLAWTLTFVAVVIGWVFFRAHDVPSALLMLKAMAGSTWELSPFLATAIQGADAARWLGLVGVELPPLVLLLAIELGLLLVVTTAPNTQQLMWSAYDGLDRKLVAGPPATRLRWRPATPWVVVMILGATWALLGLSGVSEFLYFQF